MVFGSFSSVTGCQTSLRVARNWRSGEKGNVEFFFWNGLANEQDEGRQSMSTTPSWCKAVQNIQELQRHSYMTIGQNDKGLCLRMRLADSTSPQGANVVGKTCLQMRKAVEEGGLGLEVTNCSLCEEAAAAAALAQAASSQSLEVKTVEDNTFDNINIDWLNDFDYTMLDQAQG